MDLEVQKATSRAAACPPLYNPPRAWCKMSSRLVALLLCCALCSSLALDMKWTPNGEGPAPFSKNAREEMGMDPAAMAGEPAAAQGGGGTLQLGLGALLVVYFTNNWNVVLALQGALQRLMGPMLLASASKGAAKVQATDAAAAKRARAARLSRLAVDSK